MEDDSRSFIHDLKKEWKLFWSNITSEGFRGEEESSGHSPLFPASITLEQLQAMTRNLSRQRQEIHQKLESIQKEMASLEELHEEQKLSCKNSQETLARIEKLNDLGQKWSEAVDLLTGQLNLARKKEKELTSLAASLNGTPARRLHGV